MSFALHLTKNPDLNYAAILARLSDSTRIVVATYGLGKYPAHNPFLQALHQLPRGRHVTVFTAIPNHGAAGAADGDETEAGEITSFLTALDPRTFECDVSAWFCPDNHAKIVLGDDFAYVGSANLTRGSGFNFEAGVTFGETQHLEKIADFFGEMQKRSIPYLDLQHSKLLLRLFKFWAYLPALVQVLEEHASEWKTDAQTGQGSWVFSADRFTVPPKVVKPLEGAGAIVKQLTTEASRRLDEDASSEAGETAEDKFFDADSWEDRLWGLLNDAALINEHKKFDAPFDSEAEAQALVNEFSGPNRRWIS